MPSSILNEITLEEIKRILIKHNSKIDRDLLVWKPQKEKDGDCIFFALAGTPPKGYGIYVYGDRSLYLYDTKGKRFKKYYIKNEIKID